MAESFSFSTVRDRAAFTWGIRVMRLAGLAAVLATCAKAQPSPGARGRGLAITIVLVAASLGWLVWMIGERSGRWLMLGLGVMGVSGGLLGALTPHSPAIAVGAVAALAAGGTLAAEVSIGIAVSAAVALAVGTLVVGGSTAVMVGYVVVLGAGLGTGFIRLGYTQRADAAELLLEQTQLTRAAEARAAALGERTRIAREIHDILAHSLGALSMQLEAAAAQLSAEGAPAADPHVVKAMACVERAGALARTGLAETRRAVLALREDVGLLPELLAALAAGRAEDGQGGAVSVHTTGAVRRLEADATLALYRTAQEAVTNAAKHAPGQPVTLQIEFAEHQVTLTATNPLAAAAAARPLGASGAGYGLTGLRERAELAGGTLTAEAVERTWWVCVTIPV